MQTYACQDNDSAVDSKLTLWWLCHERPRTWRQQPMLKLRQAPSIHYTQYTTTGNVSTCGNIVCEVKLVVLRRSFLLATYLYIFPLRTESSIILFLLRIDSVSCSTSIATIPQRGVQYFVASTFAHTCASQTHEHCHSHTHTQTGAHRAFHLTSVTFTVNAALSARPYVCTLGWTCPISSLFETHMSQLSI